jgi:hypothetical protein
MDMSSEKLPGFFIVGCEEDVKKLLDDINNYSIIK